MEDMHRWELKMFMCLLFVAMCVGVAAWVGR